MKEKLFRIVLILPLILLGALGLKLYIKNELLFYVHPRFVEMIMFSSVISLLLGGLFVIRTMQVNNLKDVKPVPFMVSIVASCVLVLALVLPPRPLSMQLTQTRAVENSKGSSSCNATQMAESMYTDVFLKWATVLRTCDDPAAYKGQQTTIQAFVYDTEKPDQSLLQVGRLVMRCCAVDVEPLLLTVDPLENTSAFRSGQWLRITGEFQPRRIGGELKPVLVPKQIEKINEPDEPYVFY